MSAPDRNEPDDQRVRFADLPAHTQRFLRELREDEVRELTEAIALARAMRRVGRLVRWIIITIVGTLLATVALGDAIGKIVQAVRGMWR